MTSAMDGCEQRLAMLGKMTCDVLHDIKNSLTAIRTCAEVLSYSDLQASEREQFMQTIAGEIDRIVDMTQDLTVFSHDSGRSLNRQRCSAQMFLQSVLPDLERQFYAHHITLHTHLDAAAEFQADVAKMKRVVLNIAYNARDAMPDGGVFTIAARCDHGDLVFEFTDTGCGMTPEVCARIFEPLFTVGKRNGTGLGMTIVQEILTQHDAAIEIESAPAEGTTVRIRLPRCQKD